MTWSLASVSGSIMGPLAVSGYSLCTLVQAIGKPCED